MNIKRFDIGAAWYEVGQMVSEDLGDYVRFEDHEAELRAAVDRAARLKQEAQIHAQEARTAVEVRRCLKAVLDLVHGGHLAPRPDSAGYCAATVLAGEQALYPGEDGEPTKGEDTAAQPRTLDAPSDAVHEIENLVVKADLQIGDGHVEVARKSLDKAMDICTNVLAAGRAATPPQQANPLKDHQVAQLVNALTSIAREFGSTQQLRERIAQIIRPLFDTPPQQAIPEGDA